MVTCTVTGSVYTVTKICTRCSLTCSCDMPERSVRARTVAALESICAIGCTMTRLCKVCLGMNWRKHSNSLTPSKIHAPRLPCVKSRLTFLWRICVRFYGFLFTGFMKNAAVKLQTQQQGRAQPSKVRGICNGVVYVYVGTGHTCNLVLHFFCGLGH